MKRFIKTNSGLYNQNVKLISAHNNFFLQKYFLKWCCGGVVEPMNIRVSITFRCLKKTLFFTMVMPHLFSLRFVNWSNFNPIICSWKKKIGCNCWNLRVPQCTECFIYLHEPNINSFHPPRLDFGEYISCRNGNISALAISWLFLFSHSVAYRTDSNRRSWFSWGLCLRNIRTATLKFVLISKSNILKLIYNVNKLKSPNRTH